MKKFLYILMLMSLIIPSAYADENTISFNGHRYHIFAISMTWSEAKKYCENLGGYLVTTNSEEEYNTILSMIPQNKEAIYWFGASDVAAEGDWQWLNNEGKITINHWLSGEPNNEFSREHYMLLTLRNGKWGWNDGTDTNTYPSKESYNLICEWENISDIITTTSLTDGKVEEYYSLKLEASGTNEITWTAIGLPDTLKIDKDTIKGTPTEAKTYKITIVAQNSTSSDVKDFDLVIKSKNDKNSNNETQNSSSGGCLMTTGFLGLLLIMFIFFI